MNRKVRQRYIDWFRNRLLKRAESSAKIYLNETEKQMGLPLDSPQFRLILKGEHQWIEKHLTITSTDSTHGT